MDPKQSAAEPAKDGDDTQPAGRIVHDARGNAVWKPASADSTSTMLRRLEIPGLKVEGQEDRPPASSPRPPTAQTPQVKKPAPPPTDVTQGYNPYDQTVVIRKPTTPKGPVGRPAPAVAKPLPAAAKPVPAAKPVSVAKPKP